MSAHTPCDWPTALSHRFEVQSLATVQALPAAASDCASNLCDKAVGQSQGVCADTIQLTALDSMCAAYQ